MASPPSAPPPELIATGPQRLHHSSPSSVDPKLVAAAAAVAAALVAALCALYARKWRGGTTAKGWVMFDTAGAADRTQGDLGAEPPMLGTPCLPHAASSTATNFDVHHQFTPPSAMRPSEPHGPVEILAYDRCSFEGSVAPIESMQLEEDRGGGASSSVAPLQIGSPLVRGAASARSPPAKSPLAKSPGSVAPEAATEEPAVENANAQL